MKKTCLFLASLFLVILFFFVGVQAQEPPSLQAFRTDSNSREFELSMMSL